MKNQAQRKRKSRVQKQYILIIFAAVAVSVIVASIVLVQHFNGKNVPQTADSNNGTEPPAENEQQIKSSDSLPETVSPCADVTGKITHTFSTYNVQATCTKNGFTCNVCSVCGKKLLDIKQPVGHHYGKWFEQNGALCRTCTICHKTESYSPDTAKKNEFMLNVKNILQGDSLPNGCEIVSLSIVLNYLGCDVTASELVEYLNMYSTDVMDNTSVAYASPWETYIGDPRTDTGFGCYAPCIVNTANSYFQDNRIGHEAIDISGTNMENIRKYVSDGHPVIIWGTLYMDGVDRPCKWFIGENGKLTPWMSHAHCVVVIGYSDEKYIVADPLAGIVKYEKSALENCYNIMLKQACIIR